MNDLASAKLCEIVAQYGPGVCDEPRKLRALLVDLCPGMPRQVHTLVIAAEQQVVSELLGSAATVPWSILAGRLVRRLVEETGMNEPDARWVVATWGKALGRTDVVAAAPTEPVRKPFSSPRDQPRRRFGQRMMVGVLLIGLISLGGWLAFRQRDPDQNGGHGDSGNTGTEPVRAQQKVRPALLDCTGKDGVSAAKMRTAQKAWAQYLGREVEETVEIYKGVSMTFVLVPPGKFLMGSPEGQKGRKSEEFRSNHELYQNHDESLHFVTLTEPYYLGKYEVTQKQFEALKVKKLDEQYEELKVKKLQDEALNPKPIKGKKREKEILIDSDEERAAMAEWNRSYFKGADLPVENVRWERAQTYAEQLTKVRADKRVYRLPTEAEWEYACRAGRPSSQPFGIGDGHSLSSLQANFDGTSPYGGADKDRYLKKTCPVGSYQANALGLYDMHGNVREWCADRNGPWGSHRAYRGGGWRSPGELHGVVPRRI